MKNQKPLAVVDAELIVVEGIGAIGVCGLWTPAVVEDFVGRENIGCEDGEALGEKQGRGGVGATAGVGGDKGDVCGIAFKRWAEYKCGLASDGQTLEKPLSRNGGKCGILKIDLFAERHMQRRGVDGSAEGFGDKEVKEQKAIAPERRGEEGLGNMVGIAVNEGIGPQEAVAIAEEMGIGQVVDGVDGKAKRDGRVAAVGGGEMLVVATFSGNFVTEEGVFLVGTYRGVAIALEGRIDPKVKADGAVATQNRAQRALVIAVFIVALGADAKEGIGADSVVDGGIIGREDRNTEDDRAVGPVNGTEAVIEGTSMGDIRIMPKEWQLIGTNGGIVREMIVVPDMEGKCDE